MRQKRECNFLADTARGNAFGIFVSHLKLIFLQNEGHFWAFLIHFSISTKGSVWYAIDAPYFLAIKSQIMVKMEHKNPSNYFLGVVT